MAGSSPERTSAYAWLAEILRISAVSARVRKRPSDPTSTLPFSSMPLLCARARVRADLWITFPRGPPRPQLLIQHECRLRRVGETRMNSKTEQRERTPRSFWFDPRFAIGIVLVIASVAGVLVVVSSADKTVTVLAARSVLSVGDRINADDLVEQSVRLGAVTDRYLSGDEIPVDGLIVTRTIAEGELVPTSVVGSTAGE